MIHVIETREGRKSVGDQKKRTRETNRKQLIYSKY